MAALSMKPPTLRTIFLLFLPAVLITVTYRHRFPPISQIPSHEGEIVEARGKC